MRGAALVGAALVLAALSLLLPCALAFDPLAWSVWGREVGRLALDTTTGPSWKPFPVLFTTPLALFGGAAPALWLIVARAGGLLALAGAFVLADAARRALGGRRGRGRDGALAVVGCSTPRSATPRACSAAAVLWAVVAHLAGRHRARAGAADRRRADAPRGVAVPRRLRRLALARDPRPPRGDARRRADPAAVVRPGRASARAARSAPPTPPAASRARAARSSRPSRRSPCSATPRRSSRSRRWSPRCSPPRFGGRTARLLAAGAAGGSRSWRVMTTAGYAGNPRYLVAAAALGAALAGAGAVRAATALAPARSGAARRTPGSRCARSARAVLVAAVLAITAGDLRDQCTRARSRAAAAGAFDGVLAARGRAGRAAALLAHPHEQPRALARRLAARPADARPRRPPEPARGRDPRQVVLRPGPRAAPPAGLPHAGDDAVLADRRRLRPRAAARTDVVCRAVRRRDRRPRRRGQVARDAHEPGAGRACSGRSRPATPCSPPAATRSPRCRRR